MEHIDFNKWKKITAISVLCFVYKKRDGSIRKAVGTRNLVVAQFYGYDAAVKGAGWSSNPNAYFDFERGGWRSFSSFCNSGIGLLEGEDKQRLLEKVGVNL